MFKSKKILVYKRYIILYKLKVLAWYLKLYKNILFFWTIIDNNPVNAYFQLFFKINKVKNNFNIIIQYYY